MQVFNDALGISVSHCISDDVHNKKNCYDKNKLSLSKLNKYLKFIKEGTNELKTINNININISVRNEQKNENNFKNRIKFFESKK